MKKIVSWILTILLVVGMCIPCFAEDSFTPSATAKSAPELVPPAEGDPNTFAIIYDTLAPGTVFQDYEHVDNLTREHVLITSYADRASAGDEIRTALETAYDEIKNADSLGSLCADLDAIAKSINSSYTAYNFVTADLFDLTLPEHTLDEDHILYVRLNSATDFGTVAPVVIHRANGVWKAVPTDKVKLLEDGSFTVEFDSLCPVALLKAVDREAPAPDDGNHCLAGLFCKDLFGGKLCSCWLVLLGSILLLLILIVICAALSHRKNRLKRALKSDVPTPTWQHVAMAGISFLAAGAFVRGILHSQNKEKKNKKNKD